MSCSHSHGSDGHASTPFDYNAQLVLFSVHLPSHPPVLHEPHVGKYLTLKKMEEAVSQALHFPLHSVGFAGWLVSVSADGGSVLGCALVLNSALCYLDSSSPSLSCFLASCSAANPHIAISLLNWNGQAIGIPLKPILSRLESWQPGLKLSQGGLATGPCSGLAGIPHSVAVDCELK